MKFNENFHVLVTVRADFALNQASNVEKVPLEAKILKYRALLLYKHLKVRSNPSFFSYDYPSLNFCPVISVALIVLSLFSHL